MSQELLDRCVVCLARLREERKLDFEREVTAVTVFCPECGIQYYRKPIAAEEGK